MVTGSKSERAKMGANTAYASMQIKANAMNGNISEVNACSAEKSTKQNKGVFMKKIIIFSALIFIVSFSHAQKGQAGMEEFSIRPFSPNDFYMFIKVFSEMRGPLRAEILKDKKTNFEDADPLKYVEKVKKDKSVKKALKASKISWSEFRELMGNILLAYYSIQPEKTKAAFLRQLAKYGLAIDSDQIPEEYRSVVKRMLQTEEGSVLAAVALDIIIQVPPQNVDIVRKNQKQLDRHFYTKYWTNELE